MPQALLASVRPVLQDTGASGKQPGLAEISAVATPGMFALEDDMDYSFRQRSGADVTTAGSSSGTGASSATGSSTNAGSTSEDEVFFRITHASVGSHKQVIKGSLSTTDIGIQILPVLESTVIEGQGKQVSLAFEASSLPPAALASWITSPAVSMDSLAQSLKQWSLVPDSFFRIDINIIKRELPALSSAECSCCGHVLSACLATRAHGGSAHSFIPDGQQLVYANLLANKQLLVEICPGQFRLSQNGLRLMSMQTAIQVCQPYLFFSSRESIALDDCSLLELLIEMRKQGWTRVSNPKNSRRLAPYRYELETSGDDAQRQDNKKFYMNPWALYLVLLLTAKERNISAIHHMQHQAYYRALDLVGGQLSVQPHQTAQYYRTLMTRFQAGARKHDGNVEDGPQAELEAQDDDNFGAPRAHVAAHAKAKQQDVSRKRKAPTPALESDTLLGLEEGSPNYMASSPESDSGGPFLYESDVEAKASGPQRATQDDICISSGEEEILPGPAQASAAPVKPAVPTPAESTGPGPKAASRVGVRGPRGSAAAAPADARPDERAATSPPVPLITQPRRARRQHPNSFAHGPFIICYRDDRHGISYQAECPFHTRAGLPRCNRDTRANQPDPETVKMRLMAWCNAASRHPIADIASASDNEVLAARAAQLMLQSSTSSSFLVRRSERCMCG